MICKSVGASPPAYQMKNLFWTEATLCSTLGAEKGTVEVVGALPQKIFLYLENICHLGVFKIFHDLFIYSNSRLNQPPTAHSHSEIINFFNMQIKNLADYYPKTAPAGKLNLCVVWNFIRWIFDWLNAIIEFDFSLNSNQSDIIRELWIVVICMGDELFHFVIGSTLS